MIPRPAVCCFIGALIFSSHTLGHDMRAIGKPPHPGHDRLSSRDVEALRSSTADPDARYIYEVALRWTPARTLIGCFVDGSDSQRKFVDDVKDELLSGTGVNIKIGFKSNGGFSNCQKDSAGYYAEDIRVTFADINGCAAELGTTAKARKPYSDGYIVAKNPSVFLGSGCETKAIIKHELLHALGFHHEHQKPGNACRFRYSVIAQEYNWPETTVKDNFDALKPSNAYVTSKGFDDESLMKYFFPKRFLETNDCYSPEASDLSDKDWIGLRTAYPMTFNTEEHKQKIAKKSALDPKALASSPAVLQEVVANIGQY